MLISHTLCAPLHATARPRSASAFHFLSQARISPNFSSLTLSLAQPFAPTGLRLDRKSSGKPAPRPGGGLYQAQPWRWRWGCRGCTAETARSTVCLLAQLCARPVHGARDQRPAQQLVQSMSTGGKKGRKECIFPPRPHPGRTNSTTHNGVVETPSRCAPFSFSLLLRRFPRGPAEGPGWVCGRALRSVPVPLPAIVRDAD